MDRSTLGHLLRPLEARGVVTLGVSERDRRSRMIGLTAEGETLLSRAQTLWADAEASFAAAFGAEEAQAMRVVLKRVEHVSFERRLS
jgi:DNA-binding MarR family transcriptional regulator